MATKDQVIALHRSNPTMTAREIADTLGCVPAYVRSTASRNGFKLPKHESPREKAYREALEFYANPEIYKAHPHGPAFNRPDHSQTARDVLERWK